MANIDFVYEDGKPAVYPAFQAHLPNLCKTLRPACLPYIRRSDKCAQVVARYVTGVVVFDMPIR